MRYASKLAAAGLLIALTSATFVACKKEKEQNGPSISIPSESGVVTGDQTLAPGTYPLKFKFIAQKGSGKDDADLKSYTFSVNSGTGASQTIKSGNLSGATYTLDTTLEVRGVSGQQFTYTFTVTDKNDKSASRSIKITFRDTGSTPTCTIDSFLNQTYNNQTNGTFLHYISSSGQFERQNRTAADANPTEILFVYFYSSQSGKHSIISPAILRDANYDGTSVEWDNPSGQTTNFRSAPSSTNFGSVDCAGIRDAYNNGAPVNNEFPGNGDQRAECRTGRIIAFKQGNIYGLVRVESVTANAEGATLSVKVVRP